MKKTVLLVVVMSMSSISRSMCMDAARQIWRCEDKESISFCGISPYVGVETATYYKEKKVYRACLTRVALLKPGRFTFVEEEMVHQQVVYEQLKNRYNANKERESKRLQ